MNPVELFYPGVNSLKILLDWEITMRAIDKLGKKILSEIKDLTPVLMLSLFMPRALGGCFVILCGYYLIYRLFKEYQKPQPSSNSYQLEHVGYCYFE